MSVGQEKRKLEIDMSLDELIKEAKKAKKASNKKKPPAAKKSKTGDKIDGGKTGKDTSAGKGANSQGSKSGGKKKSQKSGAVSTGAASKRGGRGRGRGRGKGSKQKGRGGARGGMTSTKSTRGGNRGRGRGKRRRGRGRGRGRKGQASSQLSKGTPERIVSQNEFYYGQQQAGRKKSFVRARPPALPHGLLFPSSRAKITIQNRPMSFRLKNDEYETEHAIEDLEYQITLENDEYISAQHSLRSSYGRRPEKILKVEKSGGLFSHIMDSEYD